MQRNTSLSQSCHLQQKKQQSKSNTCDEGDQQKGKQLASKNNLKGIVSKTSLIKKISQEQSQSDLSNLRQYMQFLDLKETNTLQFGTFQMQQFFQESKSMFQDKKMSNSIQDFSAQSFKDYQAKLLSNGFQKAQTFSKKIIILDSECSQNYEVVNFKIKLGFYITRITILNSPIKKSHIHAQNQVNSFGTFGKVYIVQSNQQEFAVKCISLKDHPIYKTIQIQEQNSQSQKVAQVKRNILIDTLQQYFFVKFFSVLQIGAKAKKLFGFDILLSQQCIQFSTEACVTQELDQKQQKTLKQSLKIMHMFNIVHRDIKPRNIMYSLSYDKSIFIDCGGCKFLQEKAGQKSETQFIGTAQYCQKDMFELISKNQKGYIDLYHNDVYCLKKSFPLDLNNSLESLNYTQTSSNLNWSCKTMYGPQQSFQTFSMTLKYYLYSENMNAFQENFNIIRKKFPHNFRLIEQQVFTFLLQLTPTQELVSIYSRYKNRAIDHPDYKLLNERYTHRYNSFSLRKSNLKHKYYHSLFEFYQNFKIVYGQYSSRQKKILSILTHKNNIQNFYCQWFSDIRYKTRVGPFSKEKCLSKIIQFCLITINYVLFDKNKYNVSIEQKIKASDNALQVIQLIYWNLRQDEQLNQNLHFQIKLKKLQPIRRFIQVFISKIWNRIKNQSLKLSSMISCLSSYYMLGCSNNQALAFFKVCLQDQFLSKQDKILYFWRFQIIKQNYKVMFYTHKNQITRIKEKNLDKQSFRENIYEEILSLHKQQQQQFSDISWFSESNLKIFQILYSNKKQINYQKVQQILTKIRYEKNNRLNYENFHQWKEIIWMLIFLMSLKNLNSITIQRNQRIKKEVFKKINPKYLSHNICFQTICFIQDQVKSLNSNNVKFAMNRIQKIINYQPLHTRYNLSHQLQLNFKQNNKYKIKKLVNLVLKEKCYDICYQFPFTQTFINSIIEGIDDNSKQNQLLQQSLEIVLFHFIYKINSLSYINMKNISIQHQLESRNNHFGQILYIDSQIQTMQNKQKNLNKISIVLEFFQSIKKRIKIFMQMIKKTKNQTQYNKLNQKLKTIQMYQLKIINFQTKIRNQKYKQNQSYRKIQQNRYLSIMNFNSTQNYSENIHFQSIFHPLQVVDSLQFIEEIQILSQKQKLKNLNAIDLLEIISNRTINNYLKFKEIGYYQQALINPNNKIFLLKSLIYTGKCIKLIYDVLETTTLQIVRMNSQKQLNKLINLLQIIFSQRNKELLYLSKFEKCKFMELLSEKFNVNKLHQYSHMALVYYFCLKHVSENIKRKMLIFISKSIDTLKINSKIFLIYQIIQFKKNNTHYTNSKVKKRLKGKLYSLRSLSSNNQYNSKYIVIEDQFISKFVKEKIQKQFLIKLQKLKNCINGKEDLTKKQQISLFSF